MRPWDAEMQWVQPWDAEMLLQRMQLLQAWDAEMQWMQPSDAEMLLQRMQLLRPWDAKMLLRPWDADAVQAWDARYLESCCGTAVCPQCPSAFVMAWGANKKLSRKRQKRQKRQLPPDGQTPHVPASKSACLP